MSFRAQRGTSPLRLRKGARGMPRHPSRHSGVRRRFSGRNAHPEWDGLGFPRLRGKCPTDKGGTHSPSFRRGSGGGHHSHHGSKQPTQYSTLNLIT